jgi:hypothetical protein
MCRLDWNDGSSFVMVVFLVSYFNNAIATAYAA